MKFCENHWNKLQYTIKDRGLWKYVAQSGEELRQRREDYAAGKITLKEAFEPLITTTMMVYKEAVDTGGQYLLDDKEDGTQYCPICEVMENLGGKKDENGRVWSAEELEKEWIEGPVDAVLKCAQNEGILE
jgi:hypothetical protein